MTITNGIFNAVEQRRELFKKRNLSHLDEIVQKEREIKEQKLLKRQSSKDKKKKSPFEKLDAWELVLLDNQKSLEWCEKRLLKKKAERDFLMKALDGEASLPEGFIKTGISEYEQSFLMVE